MKKSTIKTLGTASAIALTLVAQNAYADETTEVKATEPTTIQEEPKALEVPKATVTENVTTEPTQPAVLAGVEANTAQEVDSNIKVEVEVKEEAEVSKYDAFDIKASGQAPEEVKGGDYSTITLPEELKFYKNEVTTTPLLNETGVHMADAVLTPADKTIKITYLPIVEKLDNIKWTYNARVAIDTEVVKEVKDVPVVVDVSGNKQELVTIKYVGVGKRNPWDFKKVSWVNSNGKSLDYEISFNQKGEDKRGTYTLKDVIDLDDRQLVKFMLDSFYVKVGTWTWHEGVGYLLDSPRVIKDALVEQADGTFTLKIPALNAGEGFYVRYNYEWLGGSSKQVIDNTATLLKDEQVVNESTRKQQYIDVSGNIDGDEKKEVHEVPKNPPIQEELPELIIDHFVPDNPPIQEELPELIIDEFVPNDPPIHELPELEITEWIPNDPPIHELPELDPNTVPKEEEPIIPVKPQEIPNKPTIEVAKEFKEEVVTKTYEAKTLPKTGDEADTFLLLSGLLMSYAGLSVFAKKKD